MKVWSSADVVVKSYEIKVLPDGQRYKVPNETEVKWNDVYAISPGDLIFAEKGLCVGSKKIRGLILILSIRCETGYNATNFPITKNTYTLLAENQNYSCSIYQIVSSLSKDCRKIRIFEDS